MYLHLGAEIIVKNSDIIGIFDMDNTTINKSTRNFLAKCEKNKEVVNVSYELPKTFVLCNKKSKNKRNKHKKNRLYISQLASSTLVKRNLFKNL